MTQPWPSTQCWQCWPGGFSNSPTPRTLQHNVQDPHSRPSTMGALRSPFATIRFASYLSKPVVPENAGPGLCLLVSEFDSHSPHQSNIEEKIKSD
jgi:hypothetical protein